MLNINSTLWLGQTILKNRIVVPPMASQTADIRGFVTSETLSHYSRLAASGAALIMVEYSYIHTLGKSEIHQLGVYCDEQVVGLKKIASLLKSHGAVAGIQLVHGGGKVSKGLTSVPLIAPSDIAVPVKGQSMERPKAATKNDIDLIKASFIEAAGRASVAGFDVVELHSAHGYGLNQWLSPITNQRSDMYGGSPLNRARLLFEITAQIKLAFPEIILSVRIPGQDNIEGGLTMDDSVIISLELEKLGVNIINVSSGIGGWRRPRSRIGEGYLVEDASHIQNQVSIPVIGVGGIKTKKYIEEKLNEKAFSLAAIGRGFLNHPGLGQELGLL